MKQESLCSVIVVYFLAGWLALAASIRSGAEVWDVTSDFSTTDNPVGQWAYGWEDGAGPDWTVFAVYPDFHYSGANPQWYQDGISGDYSPSVWLNLTQEGLYGVPLGWLCIHPGPSWQPSVIRWTSPISGDVTITGAFLTGDSGLMDVYIQVNGTTVWSALDFNTDQPFSIVQPVEVGDQIDWLVTGGYNYGSTPVSITIEPPPAIFDDGFEDGTTNAWSHSEP